MIFLIGLNDITDMDTFWKQVGRGNSRTASNSISFHNKCNQQQTLKELSFLVVWVTAWKESPCYDGSHVIVRGDLIVGQCCTFAIVYVCFRLVNNLL